MADDRPASQDAVAERPDGPRRLAYLDAMRALAVTLVVVMHVGITVTPGDGGVVVFFVISGFIITRLVLVERERSGRFDLVGFYRRRAWKLAPPLLVVVIVPTLVFALFRPVDWAAVAAQVGFTYNWTKLYDYAGSLDVLPGSEVTWSLAIEEQFYIGFALVWLLLARRRRPESALLWGAVVVALASLVTRFVLAVGQPADPHLWDRVRLQHVLRGTDTRLEAIALGVALAAYVARSARQGRALPRALSRTSTLVLSGLVFVAASLILRGWWGEQALRPTVQALAAVLAILYFEAAGTARPAVVQRIVTWRAVQAVGLASYSIYLVHGPLLLGIEALVPGMPAAVFVPLGVTVSLLAGHVLYRVVEVPALALRKRREASGPPEPAAAGVVSSARGPA